MLDTRQSNNQSINVSAVSGTLVKTHPKSKIKGCHLNSEMGKQLFNGVYGVVLQVMNTHDGWVIFEYVSDTDFNEKIK